MTGLAGLHTVNVSAEIRPRYRGSSPSIRMLMNSICMAFNGLLRPNRVLKVISVSAATAVLSWKDRKFWMLWKIDLPTSSS